MDSLKNQLKEKFGFTSFKNLQEPIINNLLEGNNSFVIMPTGGGKSLCYQLPAMILDGTAIVVSPLIALMKNQVDLIRSNNTKDSVAHVLNSTLTKEEIEKVKNDVLTKETKLLFVAPETLSKSNTIEFLKKITVSFIAIDEAHCISEWGHDFRPEYRKIRDIIDQISSDIKIIALTATATPKVQDDVIKNLKIDNSKIFKSSFNRHNLFYEVRAKNENTDIDLLKFIKLNQNQSGIIYCLSRKNVEELSQLLNMNGVKSLPYHAGLEKKTREENQDKFLKDECDVIVCDGFSGNVILKQAESVYSLIKQRQIEDDYFDRFNYENYGGTPILGLNKTVVIGHGISNAIAIKNMIVLTADVIDADLSTKILNNSKPPYMPLLVRSN